MAEKTDFKNGRISDLKGHTILTLFWEWHIIV